MSSWAPGTPRRDPHTATPHSDMEAGKRTKREDRKRGRGGDDKRNEREERRETEGRRNKARTNADKTHHSFSKQDQGTHAKAQHEDSIYRGATASPWPSSSCAPGNLSVSGE